jgi:hypothetical protein
MQAHWQGGWAQTNALTKERPVAKQDAATRPGPAEVASERPDATKRAVRRVSNEAPRSSVKALPTRAWTASNSAEDSVCSAALRRAERERRSAPLDRTPPGDGVRASR